MKMQFNEVELSNLYILAKLMRPSFKLNLIWLWINPNFINKLNVFSLIDSIWLMKPDWLVWWSLAAINFRTPRIANALIPAIHALNWLVCCWRLAQFQIELKKFNSFDLSSIQPTNQWRMKMAGGITKFGGN